MDCLNAVPLNDANLLNDQNVVHNDDVAVYFCTILLWMSFSVIPVNCKYIWNKEVIDK